MLTLDQLKAISTRMAKNPKTAAALFPHLEAALLEAKIDSRLRIAAYLGQVLHECGEFKYVAELWGPTPQQLKYDPPHTLAAKLGNTSAGDGFKYRGSGDIQLTGRFNFAACGKDLGLNLISSPDLARSAEHRHRIGAWFWTKNGLNALADGPNFDAITKRVNGGYNGKAERDRYYALALKILP
jgi:putative chitinase